MDLGLFIPHIKSKGRYEVNGQVLLLPIVSNGDFYAEFSKKNFGECWRFKLIFLPFTADINAIAKIYGKQIIKNNEPYMSIDKMVVDFVMKGARFRVKDLGHQQLSNYSWQTLPELKKNNNKISLLTDEVINQFLNQNANELVQEMRVPASQSLAKVFKKFLDTAFSNLPMRIWLGD